MKMREVLAPVVHEAQAFVGRFPTGTEAIASGPLPPDQLTAYNQNERVLSIAEEVEKRVQETTDVPDDLVERIRTNVRMFAFGGTNLFEDALYLDWLGSLSSPGTEAAVDRFGVISDPKDLRILQEAWTFLQSPERSIAGLAKHATHVGSVIEGYAMTSGDAPDVVNAIFARLELLQRQHHIAVAWKELKQPKPDLLKLLYRIRMALSNAASVPDAIGEEIDRLKAEIAARRLRSETYDHMCELSALVTETLPHLANRNNVLLAQTTAPSLTSGDPVYIAVALKLAPKLRADAGKNGAESLAALQTLADRIAELAGQIH